MYIDVVSAPHGTVAGGSMHRLLPFLALAVIVVAGCKKKGPDDAVSTGTGEVSTNEFVQIDLGVEESELDQMAGSELMVATARCGDLVALEPASMMGKLKDGEIRCLDDTLREVEKQTVKDKISRVLMADAWAKGDLHRWEGIVRRHLTDIDRSDPDVCYKFAKYLSELGPEHSDECMHWAEVALENRTKWQGDVHVTRVNSLYKLRAVAAQHKWEWLEKKYLTEPTEALQLEKDQTRNVVKTLSREWLEYARSSGKDPTMAMQMCLSAAGTAGFCEEL
jgi:hypothetical protein